METDDDVKKWLEELRSGDPRQPMVSQYSRRELTIEDAKIMRLPPAYRGARWSVIQDSQVKDLTKNYCDRIVDHVEGGRGLLIAGKAGVGKTSVAAVLAKEARRWGFSVYFVTANELRGNTIDDGDFDTDMTVWERAKSVRFIVIDGFDSDYIDDKLFGPRRFEKLVRERNDNLLTTIITSDIQKSLWDSTAEMKRLRETIYKHALKVTVEGVNLNEKLHGEMAAEIVKSTDK